jgi:hypothetical protein
MTIERSGGRLSYHSLYLATNSTWPNNTESMSQARRAPATRDPSGWPARVSQPLAPRESMRCVGCWRMRRSGTHILRMGPGAAATGAHRRWQLAVGHLLRHHPPSILQVLLVAAGTRRVQGARVAWYLLVHLPACGLLYRAMFLS